MPPVYKLLRRAGGVVVLFVLFFFLPFSSSADIGVKYGLPAGLLAQMEYHESRGGAGMMPVIDVVSQTQRRYLHKIAQATGRPAHLFIGNRVGAMGVMQIIPSTFWQFAQDGDGDGLKDPLNPDDSRATAAHYLAWLIGRYGFSDALRRYTGRAVYAEPVIAAFR